MKALYTLSMRMYGFAIQLASLFNPKARLWVNGRLQWSQRLKDQMGGRKGWIWMHCASLGEFEQGRPIIEAIKRNNPNQLLLLTFYSPSGYEVRKDWAGADVIAYLPLDTPSNARYFMDIVDPTVALFVKYEFWYNFLSELKKRQVSTLLVSGIFRRDQLFFKSYAAFARSAIQAFDCVFVQDEGSAVLAKELGLSTEVSGDTRFDRVLEIVNQEGVSEIEDFTRGYEVVMVGSSWQPEEEAMRAFMLDPRKPSNVKVVLVPHEVGEEKMKELQKSIPNAILLSSYHRASSAAVLIVDRIGSLSKAYRYCTVAVLGGGFGKGIHNLLEAAVYGKPVIFGPNHQKFHEARGLIASDGGFSVSSTSELNDKIVSLLGDPEGCTSAGQAAARYVRTNAGATQKVMNYLADRQLIKS